MIKSIRIFFLACIAATLIASAVSSTALWGLTCWSTVSFTFAVIFALILLLFLSTRIYDKLWNSLAARLARSRWTPPVFILIAAAVMWTARYGHSLWGDGGYVAKALERGLWISSAAPLSMAVSQFFYKSLNTLFFINATTASSILSVLCGSFFLITAMAIPALAGRDGRIDSGERLLCVLFIAANGFFTIFFGAGGTIPLAVLLSLLFIYTSLLHIREKVGLFLPLTVFLAATLVHLANIYLSIGVLYLLIRAIRTDRSRIKTVAYALLLPLIWTVAGMLLARKGSTDPPAARILEYARHSIVQPFLEDPAGTLGLWLNILLLTGPAALLSIFFFFAGRDRSEGSEKAGDPAANFLMYLAVSALVFTLAATGKTGFGLRYDLLAPAGPAFAVFTLSVLKRRSGNSNLLRWSVLLLALLGIFHMAPVVGVSHSVDKGRERTVMFPLPPGRAEKIIGIDAFERDETEKAVEYLKASSEKAPEDDITWYYLGLSATKKEDPLDAISYFIKASRLKPEMKTYRENLGEAYIEQRWFEEAADTYLELAKGDSLNVRYWLRLGFARNNGGNYPGAIEAYETALAFDTDNEEYKRNLVSALLNQGASLQEKKLYDEARNYYYEGLSIIPHDWVARNNLSIIAMDEGDYEEAYRILEKALSYNSLSSKLHYNMALVQEIRGNYQEAFDHIKKSVELNPNVPPPEEIVSRIWEKLQAEKKE